MSDEGITVNQLQDNQKLKKLLCEWMLNFGDSPEAVESTCSEALWDSRFALEVVDLWNRTKNAVEGEL